MAVTLIAGCGAPAAETGGNEEGNSSSTTSEGIPADEIKVGFVHVSDPSDMGYTYNQDLGTQEMQKELGLSDDQIVNKYNVPEGAECDTELPSIRIFSSAMLQDIRQLTPDWTISTTISLLSMRDVIWQVLLQV